MKLVKDIEKDASKSLKVSDKEAEEALKKLLAWIGEDPIEKG
jgi:GTP cyclohydrolase I